MGKIVYNNFIGFVVSCFSLSCRYWWVDQPDDWHNEDCAYSNKDGWNDIDCNTHIRWTCEREV